jgi:hypothetical protein
MKKLWLILLSLGLVMAFSVSAFAVDVKVGAEYYVGGLYLNKVQVYDGLEGTRKNFSNPSTAFFYQRLRVGTDFVVSPCLKLVTRFDAMERIWGGARANVWQSNQDYAEFSAGSRPESENIAFDVAYVDYTSSAGQFKVGYMPDYAFGTVFADNASAYYNGQIQYFLPVGPFTVLAVYSKISDNSSSAVSSNSWYWRNRLNATRTDRDLDSYRIGGVYNFKGGETGILFRWDRDAANRGEAADGDFGDSYLSNVYVIDPYVKAQIGPVALQAELLYYFGDAAKYEGYVTGETNVSISALSVFVDAVAKFGMFNVGGSFAYLSGDDPSTPDKLEGYLDINNGGLDWNPCLLMFNNETITYWQGGIGGHDDKWVNYRMNNAWFFQGRVGIQPTPQFDAVLSISYALADKKALWGYPTTGGTYGTEIDLTGTYKITNNLSYMLGFGYLFTGDFFKGYDTASVNKVCDDFIVINKLTLSF